MYTSTLLPSSTGLSTAGAPNSTAASRLVISPASGVATPISRATALVRILSIAANAASGPDPARARPDQGEVWLHGEQVRSPRSTVGMAFQNPVLLEWRSILKNVMLPLEIVPTKLSARQQEERARKLLALVGLEGFEDKRPSELSGGMRQRASLCRALIHQPEVLILDEPFGALDAFTREDLWQIMHALKAEEPFTGVLITHDLRESIFLADQVVVLSGRPARTQFVMDIPDTGPRDLEHLYTPEASDRLAILRHQIEIAQNRVPAAEASA